MDLIKKNFIYNSLYQIFAIVVPLITTPYISRILGAKGIGEYSYAFSIAYYFVMFIKLGLENYGNRTIAKVQHDKNKLSECFCNIYTAQIIIGFIMLTFYIIYITNDTIDKLYGIIMLPYIISGILDINWLFFGLEKFKLLTIRNFIIKIITTILIFLFVKNSNDNYLYATILVMSMFFSQVLMWKYVGEYIFFVKPQYKTVLHHTKQNIILFIPVIAISLYKVMDKIMLGYFSDVIEVGYYESSEKIIQIPMALITSLGTVMLPRMSRIIEKNNIKDIFKIIKKSLYLAMFFSTSLGFGIMGVAKTFVPWFFGDGFEKCITLFIILLPSCMFLAFANVIRTQYLIPNKKDVIYIKSVFLGAISNLIINIFLIPRYGSIGAAIGTLFAEVTVCLFQCLSVKNELHIKYLFKSIFPFIIAGVVMFAMIVNIDVNINIYINLFIQVFIGIIIYMGVLFLIYIIKRRRMR